MDLLIKYILIVTIVCFKSDYVKSTSKSEISPLTLNFFANLEETFKDARLNAFTQRSIDEQVLNYISVITHTYGSRGNSRSRRSVIDDNKKNRVDETDVTYTFRGFEKRYDLKTQYLKDVVLFFCDYERKNLCMAVLTKIKDGSSHFIIYKLHNETFVEITRISDVRNNTKMAIYSSNDSIYVVLTGSYDNEVNNDIKTGVFKFHEDGLKLIQSLKSSNATDVILWQQNGELFMSIVEASLIEGGKNVYEVNTPIYKWLGKHFDNVDYIKTYSGQKITHFSIGSSNFLAVANFKYNFGNIHSYSEIFKYNLHLDKFESYQKILTNGAVDVKYFECVNQNVRENFLIFATLYETDSDGSVNYETDSIVYRYIDYYFIPFQSFTLNGATQWLPLTNSNGELLLLASTKFEGVKTFQYDGWIFTETDSIETEYSGGVNGMNSFTLENETVAVLFNENSGGIFVPIFELDHFEQNMLSWCEQTTMNLKPVQKRSKRDTPIKEVDDLQQEINFYAQELERIEKQVHATLHTININIFSGDVVVENIIFNNAQQSFEFVTSDYLNEFNVSDTLNNLLDVTQGFQSDHLSFTALNGNSNFSTKVINGLPIKWLENPNELIIEGSVTFDGGLFIGGNLNEIHFTKGDVLLKTANQSITYFVVEDLKVEKVTVQKVNGLSTSPTGDANNAFARVDAKRINLNGLLNLVNVTELGENALKTFGSQTLTAPYHFEHLDVSNLNVKKLSNQSIPEQLISVENGVYSFPNNVEFAHFNTNKLVINEHLNKIKIINGTPNFLLTNSDQRIENSKIFSNVHLINRYDARGRIYSAQLDQYKPVNLIEEDIIVLTGDYFINGNVTIEKRIKMDNLLGSKSRFSVRRLKEQGIHLSASSIPVHLNFSQPLSVPEVFVDTINGVDMTSLIIMGFEQTQIVTGRKKFPHDVTITGATRLVNVNDINIQKFDAGVLKVVGDQTIVGKHHFENIVANRVCNIKTKFNNNLWENVMSKYGNQTIRGTTTFTKSARANQLQTNSIIARSLINGLNFDRIINDTVFRNKPLGIFKNLEFADLVVQNLVIKSYNNHLSLSTEDIRFELDENVTFASNIKVQNITFVGEFNGIPNENFGHHLLDLEDQVMYSEQTFEKIVVLGNMFVETGVINSVDFGNFWENAVKLDEEFHFEKATFSYGLESINKVTLDGLFESLDLNDVVQSYITTEQVITDHLSFQSDVNVLGHTNFQGLISNYNLSKFCNFVFDTPSSQTKNLQINGNVLFGKGPEVHYINNRSLSSILTNVWFTNRDVTITGLMQFNTLNFTNHLTVGGFLDNVKTQLIATTYLSKSRNQTISATLQFDEYAIFSDRFQAKRAIVAGETGGVDLSQFMRTAILNGFDQIFETTVVADVVEIKDLIGDYLVNGLNLENDVMRYDQSNMVTGRKTIRDVRTRKLVMDKPVNVQNVDVLSWLKSCVLQEGTFHIAGQVTLLNQTSFMGELNSRCPLNDIKFDQNNIMTKSTPQVITGKKVFKNPVTFESLDVKKDLNGINIPNLLALQAYQNTDLVLNGPIKFQGQLSTYNLNVEQLYGGVNISQLILNITNLDAAENYYERYEKLLNVSNSILTSLEGQAYSLDYFEVRTTYLLTDYVFPIKFADTNSQYLACAFRNVNKYSIQFQNVEDFNYDRVQDVEIDVDWMSVQKLAYKGKDCWYAEYKMAQSPIVLESYQGEIFEMTSNGISSVMGSLRHNGTKAVTSLVLPGGGSECLFALFQLESVLFCENRTNGVLEPLIVIETANGKKITATPIQETPYIFVLNEGTSNEPPSVVIWKYVLSRSQFLRIQIIPIGSANDITTITYQQSTYLVVSSQDASDLDCTESELLDIRKFNAKSDQFETVQKITISKPIKLELVELPTNELVLYVVCDNPRASLWVYMYEGAGGFKKKSVALEFPTSHLMNLQTFTTEENDHFILIQNRNVNTTWLVEGIFKGQKFA